MTNPETKLKRCFPNPMTLPVHFSNIRSSTPTAFSNNKIYPKQTSEVTETEVATDGVQVIGRTSGISSVSKAWRSSNPGLSCCLCPGESPAAASPPRSRAGVAGSTDTKISPSPRRTPPRCTHTKRPADELVPGETGKPGPRADLDEALSRTCCAHRPAAPALVGTSKRSCSEEYRRRPPPPPFIVGAGERGERSGRRRVEGRRPRGTGGGGDNGRRRSGS
jgi:hypothetical protein